MSLYVRHDITLPFIASTLKLSNFKNLRASSLRAVEEKHFNTSTLFFFQKISICVFLATFLLDHFLSFSKPGISRLNF